jgi:hypothetical protein
MMIGILRRVFEALGDAIVKTEEVTVPVLKDLGLLEGKQAGALPCKR